MDLHAQPRPSDGPILLGIAPSRTSPAAAVRELTRQRLCRRWSELLEQEQQLQHWERLMTCRNIRWGHGFWDWAHNANVKLLKQMAVVADALRSLEG